jgi:hypothetical protein
MTSRRPAAALAGAVLALAVAGCLGPKQLAAGRRALHASHGCRASEDGRVITCGGSRYAEVGCLSDARARCRALWVEYAGGVRVWPFKPRGFDESHPEAYEPGNPKIDYQQAQHVIVALDGSRVWWWHRPGTLSSGAFHVFHIVEDRLEDVDEADVWQIWARLHEGRAVALEGNSEPWPR